MREREAILNARVVQGHLALTSSSLACNNLIGGLSSLRPRVSFLYPLQACSLASGPSLHVHHAYAACMIPRSASMFRIDYEVSAVRPSPSHQQLNAPLAPPSPTTRSSPVSRPRFRTNHFPIAYSLWEIVHANCGIHSVRPIFKTMNYN